MVIFVLIVFHLFVLRGWVLFLYFELDTVLNYLCSTDLS